MNIKGHGWRTFCMFLMGLGSVTKIYLFGTIGISEIVAFFAAPVIFLMDYRLLKWDGFVPMLGMTMMVILSMFASAAYNHIAFPYVIKSFAVLYSIAAHLIVFHRLIRENYYSIGWYFLGACISSVITVFAFNPTATVTGEGMVFIGDVDVETVVQGPLFWVTKIVPWFRLPIWSIYLKTPMLYSLLFPFAAVVMAMGTSVSGRSASLSILLGGFMIFTARKSRNSMRQIGRHFLLVGLFLIVAAFGAKAAYRYASLNDFLGQQARQKYEDQTKAGESAIRLLIRGRMEFFAAIPAVIDRPIIGHGPFALDKNGYWERFFRTYGDIDDLRNYVNALRRGGKIEIPTHSYIMGFWVHYGILGAAFWIYVVYLVLAYIRKYAFAVPQWYGYLIMSIADFAWALFFSPFSGRAQFALMVCCILFSRAIGQGRLQLPYDMEMEARKYE